jgi:Ser/Thr protein kinase RdoA (MazF antagonist)
VPDNLTAADWQALGREFGLGQAIRAPARVARGAMGEVWRLETTAGCWAVKWQFPWAPADSRPADVAVQLAAADAGIPLPLPVTTPAGIAVVAVRGRHARVYHWIDLGEPLSPPVSPAAAAEAGRLLGLLHGLALASAVPVDPWYTEIPQQAEWTVLADRAAAAGAPWAAELTAARDLIEELAGLVVPPAGRAPVVCHRDFNPDNVLPAAPGGRLTVLDWENSGPLSPDRELGYALFTWCAGRGHFDLGAAGPMVASYARAAGREPELGPDLFATAAATHLNILHVMAGQWLTEPAHRTYAQDAIEGLLKNDLNDLSRMASSAATARWRETAGAQLTDEEEGITS